MDDLVKRLRVGVHISVDPLAITNEAADRIEQMEAALKGIFEEADGDFPDIGDIRFTARAALGEKKDD